MPPRKRTANNYKQSYRGEGLDAGSKIPPGRYMWVESTIGWFQLYINGLEREVPGAIQTIDDLPPGFNNETNEEIDFEAIKEPGPTVDLFFHNRQSKHMFHLSFLTVQELDTIKELIDEAFKLARPSCVLRDKAAKTALFMGSEDFSRSYRRLAVLNRKRLKKPRGYDGIFNDNPDLFIEKGLPANATEETTTAESGTDSTEADMPETQEG